MTSARVSVITPTADRPVAFALAECYMRRQTRPPDEWIVADGGERPVTPTMGQVHVAHTRPAGAGNFAANLLAGCAAATGDILVFYEDDDWYAPTHLESLVGLLEQSTTGALVAGDGQQRYYNVAARAWKLFTNYGASLCQTAIRRPALRQLEQVARECQAKGVYGIDTTFWRQVPQPFWAIAPLSTVLGVKGLPGRVGLGIGHRPDASWTRDPRLAQLTAWIGAADATRYAEYGR